MKQEEQIGRLRKNTALKNRRLAPSGHQNRSWKGKVPAAWLHIHEKNRCVELLAKGVHILKSRKFGASSHPFVIRVGTRLIYRIQNDESK